MYPYSVHRSSIMAQQEPKEIPQLLEEYTGQNPKYGFIRFQVTSGIIPIEGATVIIKKDIGGNTFISQVLTTDTDGKTDLLRLPAPDRSLSMEPGNAVPYASYDVSVSADGYLTSDFYNIPVFDGITSIQPVVMKPDVGARNIKNNEPVTERNFDNL